MQRGLKGEEPLDRRVGLILLLLLAASYWAVWLRGLSYPFVYDDLWTLVRNPSLEMPPQRWFSFFTDARTVALPEMGMHRTIYRPIPTLSFSANYWASGLNPGAFRLWNLIGHFLVGWLLFRGLSSWGRLSRTAAALSTGVFWFHPVQVESVQWITQRSNILCAIFFLSALHLTLTRRKSGPALALLFYAGALLSKEVALAFVPVAWILDGRRAQRTRFYSALVFLSIGYIALRTGVLGQIAQRPFRDASYLSNFLTGRASLFLYVRYALWPTGLNVSHRQFIDNPMTHPLTWLGLVLEIVMIAAIFYRRRFKPESAALAWFYVPLLPVLGLVPTDTFFAERFLYIPVMGFAWLIGCAADRWKSVVPFALVATGFFVVATGKRIGDFQSETGLWRASLRQDPENPFASACLGNALQQERREEEALQAYENALALQPSRDLAFGVLNNIGLLHLNRGAPGEALRWFDRALEINPTHPMVKANREKAERLLAKSGRHPK